MKLIIKNVSIVNEGKIAVGDILIDQGRFSRIGGIIEDPIAEEMDGSGLHLLPGVIDDQVHFREPGLTHKACITTESKAAAAGGVTSFMEMPNTNPATLTQELLQQKYDIAAKDSWVNYSFFMGASNDNLDEILRTDPKNVCGIKIFMGSSTGNMLVDNQQVLEEIFREVDMLIATHCEDEQTVKNNLEKAIALRGESLTAFDHALIRNEEACLKSSSFAVELARKYNTRLHILHISTEEELRLFSNALPLESKRITSEVCVHHLYFSALDYENLGNQIKCNPAIKAAHHREALLEALLDDRLDIIATDHAPHTWEEKSQHYLKAPAGLPLVQHSLSIMLDFYDRGSISLPKIVEKMSHHPAICFNLEDRGFIREGYKADFVLVDLKGQTTVDKNKLMYRCGWSPLEGKVFGHEIKATAVNGFFVYKDGQFSEPGHGERLSFDR